MPSKSRDRQRCVSIDVHTENLIPLSKAPKHIPGNPHISTIHRWVQQGVRGRVLETRMVGGRRFTSLEAIARFISGDQLAASERAEDAAEALDRLGL